MNGKVTYDKVTAFKYGLMEPNTKDNGIITKHKVVVNSLMSMGIFMMVTGKRIKHQDMALIFIIMGPVIKANGLMTISMDKAWRRGLMAVATKESTSKARKTVRASTRGKMVASITVHGLTTR